MLLKEAITLVEEEVATAEDLDIIVSTTFGYRLPSFGPFAIADIAGLDLYRDRVDHHAGHPTPTPRTDTSHMTTCPGLADRRRHAAVRRHRLPRRPHQDADGEEWAQHLRLGSNRASIRDILTDLLG